MNIQHNFIFFALLGAFIHLKINIDSRVGKANLLYGLEKCIINEWVMIYAHPYIVKKTIKKFVSCTIALSKLQN